jgi:hypothetical protein
MIVKHVCSLGTLCHTAGILKNYNLKICSYPFDWIFSDCNIIIDCIKTDFKIFLNKENYIDIKNKWNDNQCGHKIYHSNMFNHRDPRKDADYEYYVRCIDRFKTLLANDENKLFIMLFPNMDNIDKDLKNNIIEFNNEFSIYTTNYKLLVIFHLPKNEISHKLTHNDNIDQ